MSARRGTSEGRGDDGMLRRGNKSRKAGRGENSLN